MIKGTAKLFAKIFLLSIPLAALIIVYLIDDPFKVIYSNHNFYTNNTRDIPLNRDFVSTEILLKNYPNYKYDSYIYGSSRSLCFLSRDWSKYINGKIFHFDGAGESLFGLVTKLRFLESRNMPVKNCLIILDSATLSETRNSKGHTYIKHPLTSGESSLAFQFIFLKTFLSNKFFIPYFFYKFGRKPPSYFDHPEITDKRTFSYDNVTNDIFFTGTEEAMSKNIDSFYKANRTIFFQRDTSSQIISARIGREQENQLKEIKEILSRNNTNYKIIIYPDYNQRYLDVADVALLRKIFGKENVYDYSGINEITRNITNYYDFSHCRPPVGQRILKEIYSK